MFDEDAVTRPAFETEFRELSPPKIPIPRRNYTPRNGYISTLRPKVVGATVKESKPVDLSPADLERGRQQSLAKRKRK